MDFCGQEPRMRAMDEDEREICAYLKTWAGQFVSGREIARRAGGKWRFQDNPNWATPILLRLVERDILESDSLGCYRLRPRLRKKMKKWMSPQRPSSKRAARGSMIFSTPMTTTTCSSSPLDHR